MKIFLIGYMGVGKSSLGKALALKMGLPFVELDECIELKAKMSIPEIFEQRGEAHFRQIESGVLKELAGDGSGIIACGGGTPCFVDNMAWMLEHGLTIYLRLSAAELAERLEGARAQRPIISDKSNEELRAFIQKHLEQRSVYYEQAHAIYDSGSSLEAAVDEIAHFLKRFFPGTGSL